LLGTPRYMAPEQAAGNHAAVGPVSDVYGLGGILYAILTGRDPQTDSDAYSVLERVRRGELDPPRRVRPTVPPALEAVCLRAMALKPEDRYPSALALAADVERWLADEPVGVHREPWLDRARRWGRRHRPLVAASVALLVTALAGLTATVVLVSRQQAVTAAEKKRAEEQRDRADGFYKLSREALDTAVQRISGHPKLRTGDFHDLRAELLAEMVPFYEALARQKGDDPATEAERGRAFGWLGSLRSTMGQTDEAERAFRRMVAVFTRLAEQYPDEPEYAGAWLPVTGDLGSLLRDTGRPQAGLGELRDGVRMKQALADAQPGDTEIRQELAAGLLNLAMALQEVGQSSEAEATFARSLGLYRSLADARPDDPLLASRCAAAENNLAALLKSLDRPRRPNRCTARRSTAGPGSSKPSPPSLNTVKTSPPGISTSATC